MLHIYIYIFKLISLKCDIPRVNNGFTACNYLLWQKANLLN